jgi:carbamoyl-phosphate synthase small subunit
MTGYQEAVTDPSYHGQIITFTYPMVGNYGVSEGASESDRIHARAVIMRDAVNDLPEEGVETAAGWSGAWLDWLAAGGVPAITGVDTRALVRHIRDRGAMRGGIFPGELAEGDARDLIAAEPDMRGLDLARAVTPAQAVELGEDAAGPRVAAIDTGIKGSIIRNLLARGCTVSLLPCTTTSAELLAREPDAVFLANGPGDPAALDYVVENVRGVVGKLPVFGICLGHQLLCRAVGLETFKLRFGHRGGNHPVKDLSTGRIEITAQNHGFAVVGPGGEQALETDEPVRWETDFGSAELSHINLYDRTVEGLALHDVPAACVQYHPEAGPGPHDSLYLFDRFFEMVG